MLAPTVFSPGDTSVPASFAIAAIRTIGIGIGGLKPPPSLMLTMRRTCSPSDLAYICARACALSSAARRASSCTASGWSISKLGPLTWLAPLATSASSTLPSLPRSRTLRSTLLLAW